MQDRPPGRAGVEHAGRDRVVAAAGRPVLQQGAGQAGLAQRRVELAGLEQALDPLPRVDRPELAAGQPGDDVVAQLGLLQRRQDDGRAVARLGLGQRLADLQDRVGADDGEAPVVQVQLAGAGPGAGGVQADDQGARGPSGGRGRPRSRSWWGVSGGAAIRATPPPAPASRSGRGDRGRPRPSTGPRAGRSRRPSSRR